MKLDRIIAGTMAGGRAGVSSLRGRSETPTNLRFESLSIEPIYTTVLPVARIYEDAVKTEITAQHIWNGQPSGLLSFLPHPL